MTLAVYLRGVVSEARPLIEEWVDLGVQFAAIRDACKAKGLDWGQIKALIKAQVLDERDNGERVAKLIEKAEFASSYAAMLGLLPVDMNENNISGDTSLAGELAAVGTTTPAPVAKEAPALNTSGESRERQTPTPPAMAIVGSKPEAPPPAPGVPAGTAASNDDWPELPASLDRRPSGHAPPHLAGEAR
jgi:hypothetical protein